MTTCYHDDQGWWLKGRHLEHPSDWVGNCVSCQPCPERHCPECRKGEHLGFGEKTCPSCIGKVRAALRSIVDLAACLPDEAEVRGVHSEAANLFGPYADPEAYAWRRAAKAQREDVLLSSLEGADEHHPGSVLKRWVQALCEDYGDDYHRGDDLASLTDWLDARMHRIANDVGQDFGQFRREVEKVVRHLEAVLHAGEQVELGVHCLTCQVEIERVKSTERAPRLRLTRNERDLTGASDKWQCPADENHWWSQADYRLRVGEEHLKHAAKLTASDIHATYRVPEGTTRRWANGWTDKRGEWHPPTVRKCGYDGQKRQLYSVEDVKRERDTTAGSIAS